METRDRYFEDWAIGERLETASAVLDEAQIVEFARAYDPQVFHLDPELARATPFGRLIASGWQTTALTMRLIVESGIFGRHGAIGLGVDELRWPRPVYAGDSLHVVSETIAAQPSTGKPNGVVRFKLTTKNQHDEDVLTMTTIVLLPRRPAEARR